MTIVCATELPEREEGPRVVAGALARQGGERLVLVNVRQRRSSIASARRAWRTLRGSELLLRGADTAAVAELLAGPLESTVAGLCADLRAGLLVTGPPHRLVSARWRVNTIDRLAGAVHVPLLVVREAAPFVEWSAGREELRVLVVAAPRVWVGVLRTVSLERLAGAVGEGAGALQALGFTPLDVEGEPAALLHAAREARSDLIAVRIAPADGAAGLAESVAHELTLDCSSALVLVPGARS